MPSRTDQDVQQINEIRAKCDEIETALRPCMWMPTLDKQAVLKQMSWVREHINKGRTQPPISILYDNLFFPDPLYGVDLLVLQLKKQYPDTSIMQDQVWRLLKSHLSANYENWVDESDKFVPQNWQLAESHPDRTDQYGFPFYFPTDEENLPIAGFDKERLSWARIAVRARQKYGNSGIARDMNGVKVARMPLPRLTELAERHHREEMENLKKTQDTELYYLELKKWFKDTYMSEQLNLYKQSLESRNENLKQAIKEGKINAEDVKDSKFDVDAKMKWKREQLEQTLNDRGTLSSMGATYDAWREQKSREGK